MTPFAALSQKGRGSDFSCWCAANVMSVLLKFVKKSSAFGRYECADKEIHQSFIVDFLHIFRIGIGDGRLPAAFPRLQVLDGSCQVLASTCQLCRAQYDHVPQEWFPASRSPRYVLRLNRCRSPFVPSFRATTAAKTDLHVDPAISPCRLIPLNGQGRAEEPIE